MVIMVAVSTTVKRVANSARLSSLGRRWIRCITPSSNTSKASTAHTPKSTSPTGKSSLSGIRPFNMGNRPLTLV